MNLDSNLKQLNFSPNVEEKNEVEEHLWKQIHSRILCTLMVVHKTTRVILNLFPLFHESIHHFDFFIDEESYNMTKSKVFELIESKCDTGIHGIKSRNLIQLNCQLRRKIYSGLPFILSEYYFVPFLKSYIKYAREVSHNFEFVAELLVKAVKYYLCMSTFEVSPKNSQTQPLIQTLALINTRWKRNQKHCLLFQQVWNKIGTDFNFKLLTSKERLMNDDRTLAKRVYKILQDHCRKDFQCSLSSICSKMNDNQMLGGTSDDIIHRLLKTTVLTKTDIAVFKNTFECIFTSQFKGASLPAAADIEMNINMEENVVANEEKQNEKFPELQMPAFAAVADGAFHMRDRSTVADLYLDPPRFVNIGDNIGSGGGFCGNGNIGNSVGFNRYPGQGWMQNRTGIVHGLPLYMAGICNPITLNVFLM